MWDVVRGFSATQRLCGCHCRGLRVVGSALQKKKEGYAVGPYMLAFFIFVVVGSCTCLLAAWGEVRASSSGAGVSE